MRCFVFSVICTLCFNVSAEDWQNEQHVWNEDKGKWEIRNEAFVPAPNKGVGGNGVVPEYTEEWAKYLPRTVRYGKREATSWEIKEAQRKLWVKLVLQQRAMQKAEARRKLIAYRKSVGWYASRRSGGYGLGWSMQMHVNNVPNYSRR